MLGAGFLLVPESSYTMTDHPREGARTRPLVNGQLRQLTERPRMTVREVQTMLTAAMQAKYPTTQHVGFLRRRGRGWRCFVRWALMSTDRRIPPTDEADAMLAELAKPFEIVESDDP